MEVIFELIGPTSFLTWPWTKPLDCLDYLVLKWDGGEFGIFVGGHKHGVLSRQVELRSECNLRKVSKESARSRMVILESLPQGSV